MTDEVNEIRQKVDLVELAEAHGLKLKRTGKNFVGLCPFHADKKPSLTINPSFGRYKCFSCGATGDVFNWVMNTQNVDFGEALRILAAKTGVVLSRGTKSGDIPSKSVRLKQVELMEMAQQFFLKGLQECKPAQAYCLNRDISEQDQKFWGLGFAPNSDEALIQSIKRNGYLLSEAQSLFLVEGDDSVGYRDRFRGRLMFPIRNEKGELVAYGGRVIGDGIPKYINSSDTPLFLKSHTLYGLFESRNTLIKNRHAILVEGYLDVIACHRAGLKWAVASLGTSLTENQAQLLKRWADFVTIVYDGDGAGRKAAVRAAGILLEQGLRVTIAKMNSGDDPDTILKSAGAEALKAIVNNGIPLVDFQIQCLFDDLNPDSPEFWSQAVAAIAETKSELEVTKQIDSLAGRYPGIQDVIEARKALRKEVNHARTQIKKNSKLINKGQEGEFHPLSEQLSAQNSIIDPAESTLLYAYAEGFLRDDIHSAMLEDIFFTQKGTRIVAEILSVFRDSAPEGPPSEWIHRFDGLASTLMDLKTDRFGNLNESFVRDAIQKLRNDKLERHLKLSERTSSDRLQLIQARLKAKKGEETVLDHNSSALF